MCLVFDSGSVHAKTKALRFDKNGERICYKVVQKNNKPLYRRRTRVNYAEKQVVSNRRSQPISKRENWAGEIYYGIHVFTTKAEAALLKAYVDRFDNSEDTKIIKVICKKSDLVAVGEMRWYAYKKVNGIYIYDHICYNYKSAVFMTVYPLKEKKKMGR